MFSSLNKKFPEWKSLVAKFEQLECFPSSI